LANLTSLIARAAQLHLTGEEEEGGGRPNYFSERVNQRASAPSSPLSDLLAVVPICRLADFSPLQDFGGKISTRPGKAGRESRVIFKNNVFRVADNAVKDGDAAAREGKMDHRRK